MNELLLSEITAKNKSLISSFNLIESFIFASSHPSLKLLTEKVSQCKAQIEGIEDPLDKVEHLINYLFIEEMYIDKPKALWASQSFELNFALSYKTISPILKAVVFRHIFEQCDYDADIVFVPEKIMVRVTCDDYYAIIFDPITGESIDGVQLDQRLEDLNEPMKFSLEAMSHDTLMVEHLTLLKNSLIEELKFSQALKCVDILLALRPDDPFERRDRGFLLHQLDCFKVAYDDYQYFVEQCPTDPTAQLLKIQLDKISISEGVLH